jgi:hypothetical protein
MLVVRQASVADFFIFVISARVQQYLQLGAGGCPALTVGQYR